MLEKIKFYLNGFLKINKGSPACSVIECDDTIQFIGRFPALNLRREEAVNIIRMFDVTLPLVVKRYLKKKL